MYGQFPITIIVFFFGIDVNDVDLIVFVVIGGGGGGSGCLAFFYYYNARLSLCTLLMYS